MIENYKGWDITLTWDDNHSFVNKSSRNNLEKLFKELYLIVKAAFLGFKF